MYANEVLSVPSLLHNDTTKLITKGADKIDICLLLSLADYSGLPKAHFSDFLHIILFYHPSLEQPCSLQVLRTRSITHQHTSRQLLAILDHF